MPEPVGQGGCAPTSSPCWAALPGRGRRTVLGVVVVAATLVARPSSAQQAAAKPDLLTPPAAPKPGVVEWNPDWPRFRASEVWATGILTAVALGSLAIPSSGGRWTTVNGFDKSVRSALGAKSQSGRDRAQDASDILLAVSLNQLLFDSLVVTWWGHGRGSVALQLSLVDAEAVALTTALTAFTKGITSRERPFQAECSGPEKHQQRDCQGQNRYQSYFSGHTSTSFTSAALTCQHHAHLPLYGGGAPDVAACLASIALAGTVGTMRIVSDRHYATDVLTGAAVGTLSGLTVPWLLHYRGGASPPRQTDAKKVSVRVAPAPLGGVVFGEF